MRLKLVWPGMVQIARDAGFVVPVTWRRLSYDLDHHTDWYAPWWVAWLYRWLPFQLSWHGRKYDNAPGPAFYLWCVWAPRWQIGWLPRRRNPKYGARVGVITFNDRRVVL